VVDKKITQLNNITGANLASNDEFVVVDISADETKAITKGQLFYDVYLKSNILGNVSQSSGVPTGAVIERGSNSNGEYVLFADGTQICTSGDFSNINVTTGTGNIFKNENPITWIFPYGFRGVATVHGAVNSMGNSETHWGNMRVTSSNETLVTVFAPNSITGRTIRAFAIGRWY